jgi:hypothetical protein
MIVPENICHCYDVMENEDLFKLVIQNGTEITLDEFKESAVILSGQYYEFTFTRPICLYKLRFLEGSNIFIADVTAIFENGQDDQEVNIFELI